MLILGLCLLTLPVLANGESWCFACKDVAHPAVCQEIMACSEHESCYAEKHTAHTGTPLYTSGCKPTSDCKNLNRTRRAAVTQCTECCSGVLCNMDKCGAEAFHTENRLWCASCSYQKQPNDCGTVKLCSQDELCSVSLENSFFQDYYTMGCTSKGTCSGKTLENGKLLCCNTSLCNTNTLGINPEVYTPPPPTTSPPPPSPATASIDNATIDFISHHEPNETLTIVCNVGGFPIPNVTWTFTPAAAGRDNSSSNDTSLSATAAPGTTNVTLGTTVTTSNNTGAPQSREITTGVTTLDGVSKLEIMGPAADNAGVYVCSASNDHGSANASVVVTVSAVPLISGDLNQTIATDARTDVLLDCNVTGSPSPNVTWIVPPTAGGVEHLANNSVILHNVHSDNAGSYLCLAQNSAGGAVKSFTLTVTDNATEACPSVSPASPIATPLTSRSQPGSSVSVDDQPTTVTLPTTGSRVFPMAMGSVWNSLTGRTFILQCQVTGSTAPIPITWSRLEQDFNHNDPVFTDNGHGTLVIVQLSAPSLTTTGVFECRVATGGSNDVQHFVIYKELPTNNTCTDKFSKGGPSPGTVLRATCGPCNSTQPTAAALTQDSLICESARQKGVLSPSGGAVTWLIRKSGDVALLADDQGSVKIVT